MSNIVTDVKDVNVTTYDRETGKVVETKEVVKDVVITRLVCTHALTLNLGNYQSGKFEFTMEATINNPNTNIEDIKKRLWDDVSFEIDKQAAYLQKSFGK